MAKSVINEKLDKEIERAEDNLSKLEVGSKEYDTATKSIETLINTREEQKDWKYWASKGLHFGGELVKATVPLVLVAIVSGIVKQKTEIEPKIEARKEQFDAIRDYETRDTFSTITKVELTKDY